MNDATGRPMPEWGDDPLSQYFRDAGRNERASSLNLAGIFAVVQWLDGAFLRLFDLTANSRDTLLLVPRVLMARARAAVLAGARLSLAGQTVEANMVLRGAIEASWYALHMARDPQPASRVIAWLNRSQDDVTRRECRRMFHPDRLRETHQATDPRTAPIMERLYHELIASGAHPNEMGILAAITRNEFPDGFVLNVHVLTDNPVLIRVALKFTIEVGIGVLKTFESVFPERYRITGLDGEAMTLINELNRIFPPGPDNRIIWTP